MWQKFRGFFRRQGAPPKVDPELEILEELRLVKKLARKHGILLEKMREEFLEQSERKLHQEIEPLLTFADAFFYLDRSFHESNDLSPQRQHALEMVWQRLDGMLATAAIRMFRQRNVPFDERIHEAIENVSPQSSELEVLDLIQPGYARNGRVVRAAKVIVGNEMNNNPLGDNYDSLTEEPTEDAEDYLRD